MPIVVGGVIERDGKYLLVQETQPRCYGLWSIPAGQLDPGETIFDGAAREIREECGLETKMTGICEIGNRVYSEPKTFAVVIFTTEIIGGEVQVDHDEIMDARWFSYEELVAMKEKGELRNDKLVLGSIENIRNGVTAPIEIVKIYERH